MVPMVDNPNSAPSGSAVESSKSSELSKKSFWELFSRAELLYYGTAAAVYIGLGVLNPHWVLKGWAGPGFIVLWIWFVPILVNKWSARRS